MRRANNGELWLDDNGKLIGVNLGADYCAEHEWGIDRLKDSLGIGNNAPNYRNFTTDSKVRKALTKFKLKGFTFGLGNRQISNNSKTLHNNLDTDGAKYGKTRLWGIALNQYDFHDNREFDFEKVRDNWFDKDRNPFLGFWGEGDFCFLSQNKEHVEELAKAYEEKDLAVYLAGGGPFKNAGLVLAIMSRIPKEYYDQAHESDKEYYTLVKESIATGIYDTIEKSDKSFYGLKPRLNEENNLEFWLNPRDQDAYNYGWYTKEELVQWTKNQGPIIKVKEKA